MHGAAGSLLVEAITLGSVVAFVKPNFWAIPSPTEENRVHIAAVTKNLSLTWMRMATLGMTLRVTGRVLNLTRSQCFMRCEAFDKATGKLIFHGIHEMQSVVGNTNALKKVPSQL